MCESQNNICTAIDTVKHNNTTKIINPSPQGSEVRSGLKPCAVILVSHKFLSQFVFLSQFMSLREGKLGLTWCVLLHKPACFGCHHMTKGMKRLVR